LDAVLAGRICAELEKLAGGLMFGDEDPEEIDVNDDLVDLGFDSITLLDLVHMVNRRFGVQLSALALLDFPSLALLAEHLANTYGNTLLTTMTSEARGRIGES
jgi:acyl carrier protein